jgi:hypothetical protein
MAIIRVGCPAPSFLQAGLLGSRRHGDMLRGRQFSRKSGCGHAAIWRKSQIGQGATSRHVVKRGGVPIAAEIVSLNVV